MSNLLLRMCTGVFCVRPDLLNRQVCVPVRHGDCSARRSTRVNADEPAKKPNGKSSHILTSDDRTPQLPTIWFRSASAVSEFGHPPEASGLRVAAPNCSGRSSSVNRSRWCRITPSRDIRPTLRQHPPLRSLENQFMTILLIGQCRVGVAR